MKVTKNKRILIVEDEIIVANDIRKILVDQNYKDVSVATSFRMAKTKIISELPDLILCDINLGDDKSGMDLMEELVHQFHFKLILITAYYDNSLLERAKKIHALSYLIKPFSNQQLITSVKLALIQATDQQIQEPTKRELSIINLLAKGSNSKEISENLCISKNTVDTFRRKLLKKYHVKSTAELVSLFTSHNLLNEK